MEGQAAKNDPPNDHPSSNGCSGSGTSPPPQHVQHDPVGQQLPLDGLGADDAGDNDNTSVLMDLVRTALLDRTMTS